MTPTLEPLDARIAPAGLIPPTVAVVPVQVAAPVLDWGGNDLDPGTIFAADAQGVPLDPPLSLIQTLLPGTVPPSSSTIFDVLLELDWGGNAPYTLTGPPGAPILVPHTPLPLVGAPPPHPLGDLPGDLEWGGE